MYDFVRAIAVNFDATVAQPDVNSEKIINISEETKGDILVFPELSLTGASCEDLFLQETLIKSSYNALGRILKKTKKMLVLGMPVIIKGSLYNCGVVINNGKVAGIVPQAYPVDYSGVYSKTFFASAYELKCDNLSCEELGLDGNYEIPVGASLVFDCGEFKFAVEVGGDLYAPITPGTIGALSGAEIIINIGANYKMVGSKKALKNYVLNKTLSDVCAYVYASGGVEESTSKGVFMSSCIIAQKEEVLSESDEGHVAIADIDLGKIRADRMRRAAFKNCVNIYADFSENIKIKCDKIEGDGTFHPIKKSPFVPQNKKVERCKEVFELQVLGLVKRIKSTGGKPVVGVSGGLDSTLALLVSVEAAKKCGKAVSDVLGITMPCFGTTGRTYNNSIKLMEKLGITYKEINIKKSCEVHFSEIGHSAAPDLTYENAQARERTQVLMDVAGMNGGFVVGTGDLSELALGWCTYNGDQMSMYGVNAGVPKTMIRAIVETLAESDTFVSCKEILKDILETPISPELLPPKEDGMAQVTEDIVGPYALHDFFMYYVLRFGFEPAKIYHMACLAFRDEFNKETIKKWLKNFYSRFLTQQFKRSSMPDGVKIGSVGLSPKGEFSMPSDIKASLWLSEVEKL